MRFVKVQQKSRLSWKCSQSHLPHSLLYGVSTKSQVFTRPGTKQLHWLWSLPLLMRFVLDCHQMKAVMTYWNVQAPVNVSATAGIITFSKYFKEGSLRYRLFQQYIDTFVYADKTFIWALRKIVLVTLWLDVLFAVGSFTKNPWTLAKMSFLRKMNTRNGKVVTANCNDYNEILHLWNFFIFFSAHLRMSGSLWWTINYGSLRIRKQAPKSISKNSYL